MRWSVIVSLAVWHLGIMSPDDSADIPPVTQQLMQGILAKLVPAPCPEAALIECAGDFKIPCSLQVHVENHAHSFGLMLIHQVCLVRGILLAKEGLAAIGFALQCVFPLALLDFFGQVA